ARYRRVSDAAQQRSAATLLRSVANPRLHVARRSLELLDAVGAGVVLDPLLLRLDEVAGAGRPPAVPGADAEPGEQVHRLQHHGRLGDAGAGGGPVGLGQGGEDQLALLGVDELGLRLDAGPGLRLLGAVAVDEHGRGQEAVGLLLAGQAGPGVV